MKSSPVEDLFHVFDQSANILKNELSMTYLEALAETGENIFQQTIVQKKLSELAVKKLDKLYRTFLINSYSPEQIRKAFQLSALKGMKESTQPNHQMTPDGVGMLIGYLVGKFVKKHSFRLLDPAVGTANLLTTVINLQPEKEIEGIGVDIDDLLLKLAYVSANLQEHPIHFFQQDSLEPLFIEPVDCVVCDLPVGYYPNDERAKEYELMAEKGHSYSHHLFIEQSIRYTKDGGYLFFLIPNGLFTSEQAPALHEYLKENAYIQGVLQLPLSMFKNEKMAKSIFILQKKGDEAKKPKQVLLVDLPSLTKANELEKILRQIDAWIMENK